MKRLIVPIFLLFLCGCNQQTEYLPYEIFGLTQAKKMTGKEASDFVNNLHLQSVTDKRTEIGIYRGEPGTAMIYLTYYSNADEASLNAKQMTDKISSERTPFIMGEYFDTGGKQIYRTFGMGQTHFVFSQDNVLIWLSLGTSWANNFLLGFGHG